MDSSLPPGTFKLGNIPPEQKPYKDYKGVDKNSKITSVFNHKGEINKSVNFKERSVKRVFQSTQSVKQSESKHIFQTRLAEKRAEILSKATPLLNIKENSNESDSKIERKLLDLVDECKTEQEKSNNEFIKIKGLKKQINKDIKTYFSNELIMAGTPDKLRQLSDRFSNIQNQLDQDTRKDIQSMIDHRCDRVVEQLETHMEQSDISSVPADIALGVKCRFTTDWTNAIEAASKKSFKNNKQALGSLIFKVWGSGLRSVKPHPSNLAETKKSLSIIRELSPKVEVCIEKTLGAHSNAADRSSDSTRECIELLTNELQRVHHGVKNYGYELKKISLLETQLKKLKKNQSKIEQEVNKKHSEQADLKNKQKRGALGKHKFFRKLSPDYQHDRGKIKDAIGALSEELTKNGLIQDGLQNELEAAIKERDRLATDTQKAIHKYALSIKDLDEFIDLPYMDVSDITTESLRLFLEEKNATPLTTKNKKRQAPPPPTPGTDDSAHLISSRLTGNKQIPDTVTSTFETQDLPSPTRTSSMDADEHVEPQQPAINELADQESFDFDIRDEIEKNLEFFYVEDIIDRSVTEEQIEYLEERATYSMDKTRVDLEDLDTFITHYLEVFNTKSNQGTYHNTQALLEAYAKGLERLEASQTIDQAKMALHDTLASAQQPTPRPIEVVQDQKALEPNLTSPTNTNEPPEHHVSKSQVQTQGTIDQTNNRPPPLLFSAEDLIGQSRKLSSIENTEREPRTAAPIDRQSSPLDSIAQSSLLDKVPLEAQVHSILNKYAQLEEDYTDGDSGFGEMLLSFEEGEREQAIKALQPVLTNKLNQLKQDEVEELANKLCDLRTIDGEAISRTIEGY